MLGGLPALAQDRGLAQLHRPQVRLEGVLRQELLGPPQLRSRVRGYPPGDPEGLVDEHLRLDDPVHQAGGERLLGGPQVPGQREHPCPAGTHPLREEARRCQLGHEAHLDEPDPEPGPRGREDHVEAEDLGEPDPHAGAVDRGDQRFRAHAQADPVDRRRHPALAAGGVLAGVVARDARGEGVLDVSTGAEAAPGAGEDDRTDAGRVVAVLDRRGELRSERRCPGVEAVRAVEGEQQDVAALLGEDGVGHAGDAKPARH